MRLLIGDFFSATRIVPRRITSRESAVCIQRWGVLLKREKEEAKSLSQPKRLMRKARFMPAIYDSGPQGQNKVAQ